MKISKTKNLIAYEKPWVVTVSTLTETTIATSIDLVDLYEEDGVWDE